jgi:hypothetical protein
LKYTVPRFKKCPTFSVTMALKRTTKIYIKHNEKKKQQTNVILRRTFHCSWTLQRTVLPDPAASDLVECRPRRSGVARAGGPASGNAARRR